MIIQAVLVFALLSAIFEFLMLMKLKPRTRCRVLGSSGWKTAIHLFTVGFNLFVHWGTVTGSMAAITAGLASFITIPVAAYLSGVVVAGVYYPGAFKYKLEALR